jgi:hypothetical protein
MIVIPMAGLSARFTAAGYDKPKYMLDLHGAPVFDHSIASFRAYFATVPFLIICRGDAETEGFVRARTAALGVKGTTIITLGEPTRGQADTVAQGLFCAGVDPNTDITIFNIDTFRPGYRRPAVADAPDIEGCLEVFVGEGLNWSFVRPRSDESTLVAETSEKRPISDLCCTGLYQFRHAGALLDALAHARFDPTLQGPGGESYVAPLYNHLIRQGARIGYSVVSRSEVTFCGVPAEYEALRQNKCA